MRRLIKNILFFLLLCLILYPGILYAANNSDILLFNKKEFKGNVTTHKQWMSVLEKNLKKQIFFEASKLNSQTTWGDWKKHLLTLSKKDQLKEVNIFWNRFPYREDIELHKTQDFWAAPFEFVKNSGDCEDFSIVKYFTLKELGFEIDDMRIVVLRDSIRGFVHAILAVYLDGDAFVLDNLNNSLLSHKAYRSYDAQYSVNETSRWGYVKAK